MKKELELLKILTHMEKSGKQLPKDMAEKKAELEKKLGKV
jgi:hypothetical protein